MPFLVYNTDSPTAQASNYVPLAANASITIGPMQAGIALRIAGSVYSDQNGTLYVQQSFDMQNWDISTQYNVTGGNSTLVDEDVIAPWVQLVYTNGPTAQNTMRLFCRAFSVNARG
jgi:hypothetical protein